MCGRRPAVPGFGLAWCGDDRLARFGHLLAVFLGCLTGVFCDGWMVSDQAESLILAQNERWRRA
jgi:hypothetical protein